ncbi:MAG: double-strand break repair helicase AddA [Bdellovibrionales bacterium]
MNASFSAQAFASSSSREDEGENPNLLQWRASSPQDSVWVNASAGSGKTTVLAKRVLRLLLSGVRPERVLCLTYTKAAAAEMSIRVMQRLGLWASIDDNALNEELSKLENAPPTPEQMTNARRLFARALGCPGGLRIRTIHSFAQDVLRRFPVEAGVPPHFAVMDESDARAMQDEALMDVLRSASLDALDGVALEGMQESEDFPGGFSEDLRGALRFLIVELGERGFFQAMRDALSERDRLRREVEESGGVAGYIERLRARLGISAEESRASFLVVAASAPSLPEEDLREAARLVARGDTPSYAERAERILAWLELAPDMRAQPEAFESYRRCFLKQDGEIYGGQKPKLCGKKLGLAHPDLEPVLLREAERLQALDERLEAFETSTMAEAVLVSALALIGRYEARKASRAALDYDDLIAKVAALLREEGNAAWVLYKLDGGLDHILLDEAQDTSRLQWEIVSGLTQEFFAGEGAGRDGNSRTLFVVGDEKQSIFSFQKADPESFARMRGYFARRVGESGKVFSEIPMRVSFRSAPAVLDAVDKTFASEEARAGVSVPPVRHESFQRGKLFGHVEIWPLLRSPREEKKGQEGGAWELSDKYEDVNDPQVSLSERIAATIEGMLARHEIMPGLSRPVAPGDIMILVRQRGNFAGTMVKALKRRRIPVMGVDRMRLSEQLAVKDVLALAAFALLPEDDLTLATVLKGPLVGLSEDHLMELATGREGSLWKRLGLFAQERIGEPVWGRAQAYLMRWLNAADMMTPFSMISGVLNGVCPASDLSGRQALWTRLGPDALDPLDELLNAALHDSRQHMPSLQGFLQRFAANQGEIKREMDKGGGGTEGGGQVRIMTVHASKGLEAPIVFLPDCGQVPSPQNLPKWHWDEAEGTFFYLPRKPRSGPALAAYALAGQRQQEEYKRLLYVALTRAANRLYVAGWESDKKGQGASWHELARRALVVEEGDGGGASAASEDPAQPFYPLATLSDPLPDDWNGVAKTSSSETKRAPEQLPELPLWAVVAPEPEAQEERLLAPSRQAQPQEIPIPPAAATPDALFARGKIIHRLLQSLPDLPEARREEVARQFLANPRHRLSEAQQDEVRGEVMAILSHTEFAPLFGEGSRAEVPIAGQLADGSRWSGQIDRLCLRDGAVWVVDYKTNRPPPRDPRDIPAVYAAQMKAYRALLQEVYPGRQVRCFLLWTYGPRMMELH